MEIVVVMYTSLCIFLSLSTLVVSASMESAVDSDVEADVLASPVATYLVKMMADRGIVTRDDFYVYAGRTARDGGNPMSEMVLDVLKEVVSEFVAITVGSYLGVATSRTSDPDQGINIVQMVMDAVRKNTIQKRMGCPT